MAECMSDFFGRNYQDRCQNIAIYGRTSVRASACIYHFCKNVFISLGITRSKAMCEYGQDQRPQTGSRLCVASPEPAEFVAEEKQELQDLSFVHLCTVLVWCVSLAQKQRQWTHAIPSPWHALSAPLRPRAIAILSRTRWWEPPIWGTGYRLLSVLLAIPLMG